MSKTYKIWAQIEQYDEETDEHTDLDEEFEEVGEYGTLEDARAALGAITSPGTYRGPVEELAL